MSAGVSQVHGVEAVPGRDEPACFVDPLVLSTALLGKRSQPLFVPLPSSFYSQDSPVPWSFLKVSHYRARPFRVRPFQNDPRRPKSSVLYPEKTDITKELIKLWVIGLVGWLSQWRHLPHNLKIWGWSLGPVWQHERSDVHKSSSDIHRAVWHTRTHRRVVKQ